ncbi:hypothetical protein MH928_15685 [Flavobacterium sp. WW92]|uniref:hypothetical protein n=1 Tax=unclassified Flavobacterium TaxID=196869 RepID=UPI00222502B6|nr:MULTISPECIES: hypothetical protein [unclassified Flavobacterium]WDO12750.1 hypothetical protein MH928_15685 [Flavobacterium sp. WW92]
METLRQRKLFITREITLLEAKLNYKTLKYGNENEYKIRYEDIREKNSYKDMQLIFAIIAIGFFVIALLGFSFAETEGESSGLEMFIIFGTVAVGFLGFYLLNRKSFWKIKLANNTFLLVEKDKPSVLETNTFLDMLYEKRNAYLKETYFQIDSNLEYDYNYHNLKWLYDIEVVTKAELEEKYAELRALYKSDKKSIGFER